ncbi:3'(2'),5'-bisphosphate nucleotidase CysQ family protein [Rhizobium mayense]|uniref:3'(2'),5'-bisphosphate nucleotidase CysQ family protein n=1 Tax=Rhizobium mayense TaxID=1312184 RepID=UPI003D80A71C
MTTLRRATPDIPIVAEEELCNGLLPGEIGDSFYLVDPLDETREFIDQNGDFTVNIALIERSVPVLGVVYAPARRLLFSGGPGGAEETIVDGDCGIVARRRIFCRQAPKWMIAVASRSHRTPETDVYLQN